MFLSSVLYVNGNVYLIGHSTSGLFRTNANNDKLILIQINITRLRIPRQTNWFENVLIDNIE